MILPPSNTNNPPVWSIAEFGAPFRQLAPSALQENGIFVETSECDLQNIGQLEGFPLAQSAAAIRRYRQSHPQPDDDLPTLISRFDAAASPPTLDDAQALTDALLYRLLDHLPEE